MTTLLIVESPGKIKTLKTILGAGWDVQASVGHICGLAQDGPEKLGFDMVEDRIECRYALSSRGEEVVARLRNAVARSERVLLAPDPDREGEAIAWHLAQVLKLKNPQRVTYTAITESAVLAAIARPRAMDLDLVAAQRARQVLDRLVGWRTSPLAWRAGGKSAGRVQSAALHLVCEREKSIAAFQSVDYWSVWVEYGAEQSARFRAFYKGDAQEVAETASEADDDAREGVTQAESSRVLSEAEAERLVGIARAQPHRVTQVQQQTVSRSAPAPFTTSTLQQAASTQLGFDPEKTMSVAQKLYEGINVGDGPVGLITYMRTDSVSVAPEFVEAASTYLKKHDPDNVPAKVTRHKTKEGAQEAHEAVRVTHIEYEPAAIRQSLSEDQHALYDLIWRRSLASRCAPARLQKTRVLSESGSLRWEARGMVIEFAGYTRYWPNLDEAVTLPPLVEGQSLPLVEAGHDKKRTQPPPRYSEARLVQVLEKLGIGRPSTFASTVAILKERAYAAIKGKALAATELGLRVDEVLTTSLPELVEAGFTAQMEQTLDEISTGKTEWQPWLIDWNRSYLNPALARAHQLPGLAPVGQGLTGGPVRETSKQKCPECEAALVKIPSSKVAKGYFLKCETCADLVMFWSPFKKEWERPKLKTDMQRGQTAEATEPPLITDYPCPICKKPLEEYHYQKNGEQKRMLRCSDAVARMHPKHKEAVYFWTAKEQWWSPKFGELSVASKEAELSPERSVPKCQSNPGAPMSFVVDIPTGPVRKSTIIKPTKKAHP